MKSLFTGRALIKLNLTFYKRTVVATSALAALFISAVNVGAQNITVADSVKLSIAAGEAQSTVIPPGKNSQCEQGRFLVTNDRLRPPDGVVFGQDLNQPGGTLTSSSFDMGALSTNFNTDGSKSKYYFRTNDHDLVSLSNGDVLYITGAFSRMPINLLGRCRTAWSGANERARLVQGHLS